MIEVVLNGMTFVDSLSMEDKQTCAYNILCILWCVVDTAVKFDLFLESHPWLSATKTILFSAMSSVDTVNRRLAAETLSQLCVVTDVDFITSVVAEIQSILSQHDNEMKVSASIYCLCCIQRSVDNHNGDTLGNNIIRVLITECAQRSQPLRTWCLHSVAVHLEHNDMLRDSQIIKWILMTLTSNILQDGGGSVYEERISVQLSLLHIITAFLGEVDTGIINMIKYDFITLLNIIDYVLI